MARQYTTPQISLKISGIDLASADGVYVTFANRARNITLTIDDPTVAHDSTGTTITVHLTQEQSGMFWYGEDVSVQVNWVDDDERYATTIAKVLWTENLMKEVLA